MRTTSSGLLLMLIGVVLLSAFLNGALPKLLDLLFAPAPAGAVGKASNLVPAGGLKAQPTIGSAT